MPHFMRRLAGCARIGQVHVLRATHHPDRAAAAGAAHKGDVTRLILAWRPADVRACVPLGHRIVNPLRIGHVGLDHIGDNAIRPAEPRAADDGGIPGSDGLRASAVSSTTLPRIIFAIDDAVLALDFDTTGRPRKVPWPPVERPPSIPQELRLRRLHFALVKFVKFWGLF